MKLGDRYSQMLSTNSSPPLRSIRHRPAADLPTGPTIVHCEFYASNVMVGAHWRICPIDSEVAGVGDVVDAGRTLG